MGERRQPRTKDPFELQKLLDRPFEKFIVQLNVIDCAGAIDSNSASDPVIEPFPFESCTIFLFDIFLIASKPVEQLFVLIGVPTGDIQIGTDLSASRKTETVRGLRMAGGKRVPALQLRHSGTREPVPLAKVVDKTLEE